MKKWILSVLVLISLAGCGDFEWFPDNKPNNSSTVVLTPSIIRRCGATQGATTTSEQAITVSGITSPVTISISTNNNSQYSINDGEFTSSAGTISNGQTVKVRHTSAAAANTIVITTLTIGGSKGYFKTDTTTGILTCTQE